MIAVVLALQLVCVVYIGGLVTLALKGPAGKASLRSVFVGRHVCIAATGVFLLAASTLWLLLPGAGNSSSVTPGSLAGLLFTAILVWKSGIALGVVIARRNARTDNVRLAEEDRALSSRIQSAVELLGATRRMQRIGRSVFHDVANGRESVLQWQGDARPDVAALSGFRATEWKSYAWREPDHQIRLSAIAELEVITRDFPDRRRSINEHLANFARSSQRSAGRVDSPA